MSAWLVMDTSAPEAVVGVVVDGAVQAEHALTEMRRHAESLPGAIDDVLTRAGLTVRDLTGVACGEGPGSFVGVRVGLSTCKGLTLGLGVPLVGLPTLVALAASVDTGDGVGLAVLDAKRSELYVQQVERRGDVVTALHEPEALTPAAASERAQTLDFIVGAIGQVTTTTARRIERTSPSALGLSRALASVLAQASSAGVVDETETLVPRYSRAPDAKLPAVDPAARRPVLA